MQLGQQLIPVGVDFDSSNLYLKSDRAFFLKGIETSWVINGGNGQNAIELKPAESNFLYTTVQLPQTGINTVIGYYFYAEALEGYVIVHNEAGYHFIYRIRGIDGQAEIVYNFCKDFKGISKKPKYYFSEGRIAMKSLCRFLPDGSQELYKEMYLVNKKVDNLRIVVEDSIATNSFTTPYFTPKDGCCGDRCRIIKSGVPTPISNIKVIPIPATAQDIYKQNKMLDQMFQFRVVHENAWGQRSEYGIVSDQYFNNLSGCARDGSTQPHCVWLEMKTPCPEIVKVTVVVRSCQLTNGSTDGNLLSNWKEAFTIDLYDQTNASLNWYDRQYDQTNSDFQFINNGKKVRVKFCNNRECKPIAQKTVRNQNPAPVNSGTVASIGKGLAYGDNENGLPVMPREVIKDFKLELIKSSACAPKYSHVKVWAVVTNYDERVNEPVYTVNGVSGFGGFSNLKFADLIVHEASTFNPKQDLSNDGGLEQRFPDGVKNFRGILAGENNIVEAKQYLYSSGSLTAIDTLNLPTIPDLMNYLRDAIKNGKILVQCFDFGLVKCGPHYFRIVGHNDTVNLESTSTYYRNNMFWSSYRSGSRTFPGGDQKEIYFNTASGADYDSMINDDLIAVIQDLSYPGNSTYAVDGYLLKDKVSKEPIELAEIHKTRDADFVVGYTDHNGFFFWTTQYGTDYKIQLKGAAKCNFASLLAQTGSKQNKGTTSVGEMYVVDRIPNYSTDLCSSYIVSGNISECGVGGGIEGIAVILGRTRPVYTNSKGDFKVIAHYSNGRGTDKLIFASGRCLIVDCNCGPINTVINVTQPSCTNCLLNTVSVGNFSLKTIITKGFPHGSRVQVGTILHDWAGRQTYVQTNEDLYMDFPSEQEQGDDTYPLLKVKLPASFPSSVCKNFKNLTLVYSRNTNYEDFLTWAADEVDFVDSAGNINTINPSKIRIWWRSLNQYNLQRGLKTNTNWSFKNAVTDKQGAQTVDSNNVPVFNGRVGDIVEFIQNADGKYLPPNVVGNVQYQLEGSYFLVDYDERFKDIKEGVKFKLKRPYECETFKTFYEYSIPLNFCGEDCKLRDDDGNIVTELIVNGFSSYSLPRQIPVVKDVTTTVSGQDKITEIITTKIYPFAFEHHSPSDTWGDHCNNGGRVFIVNPYEGKKCDRNQVLITGSLNQANDGAINYLHYFSLEDEYIIDEQGWGGITAMLVRDDGQILLICEFTTFSFRSNDDRAVVDERGYIRLPVSAIFGKPERNPYFNFGCQSNDINTIRRSDSIVVFLDIQKQAIVMHNFSEAIDISEGPEEGIKSWLVPSIKEVKANPDTKYWHMAFDFRLQKIYLTKFDLTTDQYVNNEIENNVKLNETVAYYYTRKVWRQSHFTPEYFGSMFGELKDSQFFSFKNALPYAHHDAVNPGTVYLNYFGIQCFPVIGVATNKDGVQEKSFLSNTVHCREILFVIQHIETSMGQKSSLLEGQWEQGAGMSYASYLCDTENLDGCNNDIQEAIFDSDTLYGKWLKAIYTANSPYNGEFFLLSCIESFYIKR